MYDISQYNIYIYTVNTQIVIDAKNREALYHVENTQCQNFIFKSHFFFLYLMKNHYKNTYVFKYSIISKIFKIYIVER